MGELCSLRKPQSDLDLDLPTSLSQYNQCVRKSFSKINVRKEEILHQGQYPIPKPYYSHRAILLPFCRKSILCFPGRVFGLVYSPLPAGKTAQKLLSQQQSRRVLHRRPLLRIQKLSGHALLLLLACFVQLSLTFFTAILCGRDTIVGRIDGEKSGIYHANSVKKQSRIVVQRPSNNSFNYLCQKCKAKITIEILSPDRVGRLAIVDIIHDFFLGIRNGVWMILEQSCVMQQQISYGGVFFAVVLVLNDVVSDFIININLPQLVEMHKTSESSSYFCEGGNIKDCIGKKWRRTVRRALPTKRSHHILMQRMRGVCDPQHSTGIGSLQVILMHNGINFTPIIAFGLQQSGEYKKDDYHCLNIT